MKQPCFLVAALALALAPPALAQCGSELLAAADLAPADAFGGAVDADGSWAVVGAWRHGDQGAAYFFERRATGWVEADQVTVVPSEGSAALGFAVALDGDRALVSAHYEGLGDELNRGAAYVFERSGTAWVETARLETAAGGGGDFLGDAVALQGDLAALGAPGRDGKAGAVVLFERLGGVWQETVTLSASDAGPNRHFGTSIALDGDRLLVGSTGTDALGESHAYLFELAAGGWGEVARLSLPSDPIGTAFGLSVDLGPGVAVVGAPNHDGGGLFNTGAFHVFEEHGGAWGEVAFVLAPTPGYNRLFGSAVTLHGDRIAAGEPAASSGSSGAAYVYERQDGAWTFAGQYQGDDPGPNDFGAAVDLEGSELWAGASQSSAAVFGAGAVFVLPLDFDATELEVNTDQLAVDVGGYQDLTLRTCPPVTGQPYALLGSASGTAPGFAFGGAVIPLNFDAYFAYTLAGSAEAPFVDGQGVTGADGTAHARILLPPGGDPVLSGGSYHHAFVVLDAVGGVAAVSEPAALTLGPSSPEVREVGGPAPDFATVAEAIASPLVEDGDVLLVHDNAQAEGFTLTKALTILAPAGGSFSASPVVVRDVVAFTISGLETIDLTVEDVPFRARLNDVEVGGLTFDEYGGFFNFGRTRIERCGELVVAGVEFAADDACYPDVPYAGDAVRVEDSAVTFVACELVGGEGAGGFCTSHYPTSGAGLVLTGGSEATVVGSSLSGGWGPFDAHSPAVRVDEGSSVSVRGSSSHLLSAISPATAIGGDGTGSARLSGVTFTPAALPAWVTTPLPAEPYLELVGAGAPGTTVSAQLFGPAGQAAFLAASTGFGVEAGLLPVADPLWLDPGGIVLLLPLVTAGQEAATAVDLALPPGSSLTGFALALQAFLVEGAGLPAALTNVDDLVFGW
ncbi:MAG: FG-GAP repeat protein [Planctomycetota bacterium]